MSKAPQYWHLLTYSEEEPGKAVFRSVIASSKDNNVTLPLIANAKQANRISQSAVLVSVSSLGFMTERQMNGRPDVDPPTMLSAPFKDGTRAAMQSHPGDANPPSNPYVMGMPDDPEQDWKAREWANGFSSVREIQGSAKEPIHAGMEDATPRRVPAPKK